MGWDGNAGWGWGWGGELDDTAAFHRGGWVVRARVLGGDSGDMMQRRLVLHATCIMPSCSRADAPLSPPHTKRRASQFQHPLPPPHSPPSALPPPTTTYPLLPPPFSRSSKKWGDVEFPLPFGRTMTAQEEYVHSLDEATGRWCVCLGVCVCLCVFGWGGWGGWGGFRKFGCG